MFYILTIYFVFLSVSQGRIACANVLSDLYAMGITECDNMLMLLSVSQKMNEKVRDPVWMSRCYYCHVSSDLHISATYLLTKLWLVAVELFRVIKPPCMTPYFVCVCVCVCHRTVSV